MDWTLAIEKNREALKRILAMLVAMVTAANGGSAGAQSSAGGQFTFFPRLDSPSQNPALAEKRKLSPAPIEGARRWRWLPAMTCTFGSSLWPRLRDWGSNFSPGAIGTCAISTVALKLECHIKCVDYTPSFSRYSTA